MKRIFHSHDKCEEFAGGMWRSVPTDKRLSYVEAAANLMRDVPAFEAAMMRAVNEWPTSCEQNLTAGSVNQQAWIGHAGCCLATGSPEDCTRLGWRTLTEKQQNAANAAADRVLAVWRKRYIAQRHIGTLFELELFDA